MWAFLKRTFRACLVLLLVLLLIWWVLPWLEFADYAPLGTTRARLIATGLALAAWMAWAVFRWFRARRAASQLAGAVVQQLPEKERVSPEAAKLRERFEEAVGALTRGSRDGRSLYDLPWYIFIGAPGSGKTTALVNSGLRFPLEQRMGKAAIRGIGGTRNCDWWFTDDAVFLDTAGRYTTQDSDPSSDSEGWKEFLALLVKYRKRRPINGVILTLSAQDLMTLGEAGREAHVEAAQRRLRELVQELRIQIPVYLMVTKCDMVAGFSDYFEDQTAEGRAQVWGVTFPYQHSVDGRAAGTYPEEFDALMTRLNARLFPRIEQARGHRQRAGVFAFPQQMAALREPLVEFVQEVFARRADRMVLLRGVYFTSGTQDGTQIDRLLGAIGRRFGIAADAVAPAPGRGKAYFVERLLKQVVVGESGLAGVNRRLESAGAVRQFAGYAAVALMVALGVAVLSASYSANRTYIGQVAADLAALKSAPMPSASGSAEALVPRLDAMRAALQSADRHREHVPWSMRWGLFQGRSLANAARDAYERELDEQLLPRFRDRLRQRLMVSADEPELLFDYLKGYLMLAEPARLDKKHLQALADQEWRTGGGAGVSLADHFASLLEYRDVLRPVGIDQELVRRVRATIRDTSVPAIIYRRLQSIYTSDTARALRLDVDAAVGVERVFRRKSGRPLSEPISGLYRKEVFKEITSSGTTLAATEFAKDSWVWSPESSNPIALGDRVSEIYERDYLRTWDDLLADLDFVPFATVPQYKDALAILTRPSSPLRAILRVVADNTAIVTPAAAPAPGGTSYVARGKELLEKGVSLGRRVTGVSTRVHGRMVTERFEPIHRLVNGSPAPLDALLDQLRKLHEQVDRVGSTPGATGPLAAVSDPALLESWRALRQAAANLPTPIDALIVRIGAVGGERITDTATSELQTRYSNEVVAPCRTRVDGRYPFASSAAGMSLNDFAEVFGPGGVFDGFFTAQLAPLVDTTVRPWAWRPESVHPSERILAQFERAARIRRMFFSGGSKLPSLSFVVRLSNLDVASKRFWVEVADVRMDIRPGEQTARQVEWPGPKGGLSVRAVFEDDVAAPVTAERESDPWAVFRLVDRLQPAQPPAELLSTYWVQTPQHRAQIGVQAQNADTNPFAREWRRFSCEP